MMRASTFIPDCLLKLAILRKQEYKLTLFISICPSVCYLTIGKNFFFCFTTANLTNYFRKSKKDYTANDIE